MDDLFDFPWLLREVAEANRITVVAILAFALRPNARELPSPLFDIPPKIPSLWAQLQRQEETRRVLRRAKLVVLLLVSVRISCAMRCEVLSRLLWHQRHGVGVITFFRTEIPAKTIQVGIL